MINIKNELESWLVDFITETIHSMEVEDFEDFNQWAKSFKRDEADFVVKMEFPNDWGYDERIEITEDEAIKYAGPLIQRIVDNWFL